MDAVILVQARMESSRLFGKVIMPLKGKPLILRLLERLGRLPVKNIISAVSDDVQSEPLRKVLSENKMDFYAGDPLNVFKRFSDALESKYVRAKAIVRVTADNPLTDIVAIQEGVEKLIDGSYDYLWIENCPVGMGCDIFDYQRFMEISREDLSLAEQEHIIPAFQNRNFLKSGYVKTGFSAEAKKLSFTVDTITQFRELEQVYENYFHEDSGIDLKQLIADYLNKKPQS